MLSKSDYQVILACVFSFSSSILLFIFPTLIIITSLSRSHTIIHCFSFLGNIDSKGQDPRQFSTSTFRRPASPWLHSENTNNQNVNTRNRARDAARETRNEAARETRDQAVLAGARAAQNRPRTIEVTHVTHNPQPAQPQASNSRRVPSRSVQLPTTTTQAPKTTLPEGNVEYEYVDYDLPQNQPNHPNHQPANNNNNNNQPQNQAQNGQPQHNNKRAKRSPRRKGTLPSIPQDFMVTRPEPLSTTDFTCADKLSGLAYADVANECAMFHLCLPTETKGKLRDHQMFCPSGQGYNQEKGACQELGTFDCKATEKFYIYNKLTKEDGRRKWPKEKKASSYEKRSFKQ